MTSVSASRSYQSAAPLVTQHRELLGLFAAVAQWEVGERWDAGGGKSWQDGTRRPSRYIAGTTKFFQSVFSNENGQRTGISKDMDPEGLLLASAHLRAL